MRLILFTLFMIMAGVQTASAERFLVFAAASMKDALEEIAGDFEKDTGNTLVLSFAGTAKLARQIEAQAPADIFISADQEWMDWLEQSGRIEKSTRRDIIGNRLVIAVRNEVENWADPLAMLTKGLAAIANPDAIPAGRYAKQALEKTRLWEKVSAKAVRTENVRFALALVARGEVEAAIVYRSDVEAEPRVRTAFYFRSDSHSKIAYPAAIVKGAKNGAPMFLDYLTLPKTQKTFVRHGFLPAGG